MDQAIFYHRGGEGRGFVGITWFPGVTEGDQLSLITYKRRIYKGRINGKLIAHEGSEGRGGGLEGVIRVI